LCLPKSRDFGRNMLTPSVKNQPPTVSDASWRTRWPHWRGRRLTSGANWQGRGGRPTRPSPRSRLRRRRPNWRGRRERAEQLQERLTALESRVERAEAASRAEAERTRKQLMDTYHELGAWTGDFEVLDREPGLRCLEWVQEELQALPTVVEGFMSYASLVTCEGAMNALSHEGCRHFEVFDQADEDFERDIYKVEDPIVKDSAGAIYDRMWGPHGREVVRERAETARAQVTFGVCLAFAGCGLCVGLLNLCAVS
jgi:hypothetical protein